MSGAHCVIFEKLKCTRSSISDSVAICSNYQPSLYSNFYIFLNQEIAASTSKNVT